MLNWNVDLERFKKEDPEGYKYWRIVQLINYGFDDDEYLTKEEIIQAWPKIKDQLDPYMRRLLVFIIWDKLYSLPDNLTFWNSPKAIRK